MVNVKSTYNNEDSGLCLDASDGNVYNLKLYPFVVTGGDSVKRLERERREGGDGELSIIVTQRKGEGGREGGSN